MMRRHTGAGLSGVMALMFAATAACSPGDNAANDSLASGTIDAAGASAAAATATPTADFSQMSDANISSTVGVINGGEIQAGELAMRNAVSPEVKAFARDMVAEHRAMQKSIDSLATAKNVTPQSAPTSESLRNEMAAMQQRLDQMSGAMFDSAYITGQVADHQKALDALNAMATAAQDADVRAAIQAAIPQVQAHLERARALATNVRGTGSGSTTGTAVDSSRRDSARRDTTVRDTTRR